MSTGVFKLQNVRMHFSPKFHTCWSNGVLKYPDFLKKTVPVLGASSQRTHSHSWPSAPLRIPLLLPHKRHIPLHDPNYKSRLGTGSEKPRALCSPAPSKAPCGNHNHTTRRVSLGASPPFRLQRWGRGRRRKER